MGGVRACSIPKTHVIGDAASMIQELVSTLRGSSAAQPPGHFTELVLFDRRADLVRLRC